MIELTIIQGGTIVYHSATLKSLKAMRSAMRSYIERAGRRTARHAQVRIERDGKRRSCRLESTLAYRKEPRAVAA